MMMAYVDPMEASAWRKPPMYNFLLNVAEDMPVIIMIGDVRKVLASFPFTYTEEGPDGKLTHYVATPASQKSDF
jgi:hypothetical protein